MISDSENIFDQLGLQTNQTMKYIATFKKDGELPYRIEFEADRDMRLKDKSDIAKRLYHLDHSSDRKLTSIEEVNRY